MEIVTLVPSPETVAIIVVSILAALTVVVIIAAIVTGIAETREFTQRNKRASSPERHWAEGYSIPFSNVPVPEKKEVIPVERPQEFTGIRAIQLE